MENGCSKLKNAVILSKLFSQYHISLWTCSFPILRVWPGLPVTCAGCPWNV